MSMGSSTPHRPEATGHDDDERWARLASIVEEVPRARERRRWWDRPGVGSTGERALEIGGASLLFALAIGWVWTLANAKTLGATTTRRSSIAATVTAALTNPNAPTAAYLTDAAVNAAVETISATSLTSTAS